MASVAQIKNGSWEAQVRMKSNGKLIRQTRRFDTETQAQDWADDLEAAIKQARNMGRILPTNVTLAEAFAVWTQDIQD